MSIDMPETTNDEKNPQDVFQSSSIEPIKFEKNISEKDARVLLMRGALSSYIIPVRRLASEVNKLINDNNSSSNSDYSMKDKYGKFLGLLTKIYILIKPEGPVIEDYVYWLTIYKELYNLNDDIKLLRTELANMSFPHNDLRVLEDISLDSFNFNKYLYAI